MTLRTGMNCCVFTAGTCKSHLQAWGFVGLFVLSCWTHQNPLAIAGWRSSAPLDSRAQVQLVSSSWLRAGVPHTQPCLRCLWSTQGSHLRQFSWIHHIPAHLQCMEEVQLAQGVGNGPRAAGQTGSQHCFMRHKSQSCLFRKDCCLLSPRKPSSLKLRNSNYLLRPCLAPLKLYIFIC